MAEYVGYRTQKARQRKSKKKKLWKVLVVLLVLAVIFVVVGAAFKISPIDKAWDKTVSGISWLGRHIWPFKSAPRVTAADFLPEGKKTVNYLIVLTKRANNVTMASTVVLASYDSRDKTASLILIPNDLLVSAPGMGSDTISNLVELNEGRINSTRVTVENILGVKVDRYVLGTDRDMRVLLGKLGPKFTVDVPSKVSFKDPSLGVTVDLKPGKQSLTPAVLASYMTFGPDGKMLDLAKRQAEFVPEALGLAGGVDVTGFVGANADVFDTDSSNKELTGVLKAFLALKGNGLKSVVLPVKEFKFEKTVVHRIDQPALDKFVKAYVKSDEEMTGKRVKIEVLNGCGVPGIGEKVSSKIDLSRYQIVNSANADTFDHPETLIIIYSDSKQIIEAANELRDELEVGKVESHPQSQSMSDISVVVGKDYANK